MKFKRHNASSFAVISAEDVEASMYKASQAYESVLLQLGPVEEAETVLSDCAAALASIEKYGCQAANMSVFDHNGELSKALGKTPLDLSSLESLAADAQAVMKSEYTAGLEGLARDAWNAFVKAIENIVKAITDWFKRTFDKNEKYKLYIESNQSALDNADIKGAKATLMSFKDAKQLGTGWGIMASVLADAATILPKVSLGEKGEGLFADMKTDALKKLEPFGVKFEGDKLVIGEFPFKEEEKTLGELGYDSAKAKGLCKEAIAALSDQSLKKLAQEVDKAYVVAMKEAKAAGEDDRKQQLAKSKKAIADQANQIVKFGNQFLTKLAYSAYVCVKAAKSPAKAEGEDKAKEDEAKK